MERRLMSKQRYKPYTLSYPEVENNMRCLVLLLLHLVAVHVGRSMSHADSVSIHISYFDDVPPISATVADPWELKRYCDSAVGRKDLTISLWLQATTPAMAVVEALRVLPHNVRLILVNNTCQLADSLFMLVRMPNLQFLSLYCATADSLPNMAKALPALRYLGIRTWSSTFPCAYLKMLPGLTDLALPTTVSSEACGCDPSRRLIVCAEDTVDESLDVNALFIKTGAIMRKSDVSQLYSTMLYVDSIPARAGTRRYHLVIDSLQRSPYANGVLDRLVATLYAQVRAGKGVLVTDAPETRAGFLRLVEDKNDMIVQLIDDTIVLRRRSAWDPSDAFTFRGPLTGLLRQLIADGCL